MRPLVVVHPRVAYARAAERRHRFGRQRRPSPRRAMQLAQTPDDLGGQWSCGVRVSIRVGDCWLPLVAPDDAGLIQKISGEGA
jgi:hypothetical protein